MVSTQTAELTIRSAEATVLLCSATGLGSIKLISRLAVPA